MTVQALRNQFDRLKAMVPEPTPMVLIVEAVSGHTFGTPNLRETITVEVDTPAGWLQDFMQGLDDFQPRHYETPKQRPIKPYRSRTDT